MPRAGASHRSGRPSQGRGRKVGPANVRRANRFDGAFGQGKSGRNSKLKRQLAAGGHAEGRAVAGCRVSVVAIVAAGPRHLARAMCHMRRGALIGHRVSRGHHIETGHRRRNRCQKKRNRQRRRKPVTTAFYASAPDGRPLHDSRLTQTSIRRATQKSHRKRPSQPLSDDGGSYTGVPPHRRVEADDSKSSFGSEADSKTSNIANLRSHHRSV